LSKKSLLGQKRKDSSDGQTFPRSEDEERRIRKEDGKKGGVWGRESTSTKENVKWVAFRITDSSEVKKKSHCEKSNPPLLKKERGETRTGKKKMAPGVGWKGNIHFVGVCMFGDKSQEGRPSQKRKGGEK